ncbi:hypothetical protein AB4Y90_16695 [Chryseobacterium sp. 2TAF14]|uniref:hypothetical protein n=1 Tax=Chryseobacterium sp. 2TAF14 TaxID=3233007 RepID=UPI003F8F622F
MKNIIKFIILLFIAFSCKANAQLDTLQYINRIAINKQNYIGKPFSVLLKALRKVPPKKYFTIDNCDYDTQFFFSNKDGATMGKYKMLIVWKYSSFYNNERLHSDELCDFDNKAESI